MTPTYRIVRDPLWNTIRVDETAMRIVDTPAFQRLRYIRQLGFAHLVYPGATHTRFDHALGVYHLAVTALPGPSAPLVALLLSGLPSDRFFFGGFLPPKSGARRQALQGLRALDASLIFFEGASRLAACLADMESALGDREAAVARELTKLHEEVRRGRLGELAAHYATAGPPRGEIVIVVGPAARGAAEDDFDLDGALKDALKHASLRDAAATVAAASGLPRRQVYARALELAKEGGQGEAES